MNLEIQIGIALAVLGAVGTNLGALCKHRGACNAPLVDIRRPLATVRDLLRSRWFLSGVGLVLLAITFPALHGSHSRFAASAMIAFEGGLMVISILLVLGPRREKFRAHRGVLFGAAAGTLFGLSDVTVKALTGELASGPMAILASPWLIVAVTTGVLAQYTAVRALQEGEAVPVIALTGLAANISNIAGGVIVFGDPLAGSPVGLCLQALAFLMICAAA